MKVILLFFLFLFNFSSYGITKKLNLSSIFPPGEYESQQLEFCSSGKLTISKDQTVRLGQNIFFTDIDRPMVIEKGGENFSGCVTKRKTILDRKLKILQEKSETQCQDKVHNSVATSILKRMGKRLLYVGIEKLIVNSKEITRKVRCEFIKK